MYSTDQIFPKQNWKKKRMRLQVLSHGINTEIQNNLKIFCKEDCGNT